MSALSEDISSFIVVSHSPVFPDDFPVFRAIQFFIEILFVFLAIFFFRFSLILWWFFNNM